MQESYKNASWLSKLLFYWIWPVLKALKTQDQNQLTLLKPDKDDNLDFYYKRLQINWDNEVTKENPSFAIALIKTFWKLILKNTIISSISVLSNIGLVVLQGEITEYYQTNDQDITFGLLLAAGSFAIIFFTQLFQIKIYYRTTVECAILRLVGQKLLIEKICKISYQKLQQNQGKIVNLASSDLELFDQAVGILVVPIAPVHVLLTAVILYSYIGIIGLFCALAMVMLGVLAILSGQLSKRMRGQIGQLSDRRIQLLNDFLCGIRILKLYGWDQSFNEFVKSIRKDELNRRSLRYGIRFSVLSLMFSLTGILSMIVFIINLEIGNELDLKQSVVVISTISTGIYYQLGMFGVGVDLIYQLKLNCERITHVFMLPDQQAYVQSDSDYIGINCNNLSLSFTQEEQPKDQNKEEDNLLTRENVNVIENLTLKINKSDFVVLLGKVGSGKSALLQGFINNMHKTNGKISVVGSVAYVEPDPVILSDSIKSNIIFGKELDQELYEKVIQATQLAFDIQMMKYKDSTLVGEKGIKLSGGQKARISLARAIYSESDIYLLDDPLSAVDSEVGARIMQDCFLGLLKDKLILLATHQASAGKYANRVLVLERGQLKFDGSYQDLDNYVDDEVQEPSQNNQMKLKILEGQEEIQEKERMQQNDVSLGLFWRYFSMGFKNIFHIIFYVVIVLAFQACTLFEQYWLNYWSDQPDQENSFYLEIMIYQSIAILIFSWLSFWMTSHILLRSSTKVYMGAQNSLMNAFVSFFDQVPLGIVINRMSSDTYVMDEKLVSTLNGFVLLGLGLISSLLWITIVVPYIIIPSTIIIVLLLFLNYYVIGIARKYRQFELVTRSNLFSNINSMMHGITAIRCYKKLEFFKQRMSMDCEVNLQAYFTNQSLLRFILFAALVMLSLIFTINILFLVLLRDSISSVFAASSLSFIVVLVRNSQLATKTYIEADNFLVSPLRLLEYQALEQELKNDESFYIKEGQIEFKNVKMKYQEDYVLKGISFLIPSGIKCGIVGRTGAGKSSIIQVLFQIYPQQKGQIIIDGVDISKVGVRQLRSQLSIIPQQPFIFASSLRKNLDPLELYTDDEIQNALKISEMISTVESFEKGLDQDMGSQGLSSGQKQLLCLARALLKRSKVLVMDEATSNIDFQTDQIIQKCIRQEFADVTILTIAHRLETIQDYDMVLVVSQGKIIEQGKVEGLIKDKNAELYKLYSNGT